MTGTTNCEPQLDGIQKRFSFMYQTGVKSHVIVLDHNLGKIASLSFIIFLGTLNFFVRLAR